MKNSYLALICGVLLFIVLSMAWCKPTSTTNNAGAPSPTSAPLISPTATASPSPSATPTLSPTATPTPTSTPSKSREAAQKAAPSVVQISVFDPTGKLMRTGTGFFISDDGKFVASSKLAEGAANAIVTTSDNKIYNVAGVLSESSDLDLAVLQAETKQNAFLNLEKAASVENGSSVGVVGNPLAHRESAEAKIVRRPEGGGESLETAAPLGSEANDTPVVNENGAIVGIVEQDRRTSPATNNLVPASKLKSLVDKLDSSAVPHFAASPVPGKTPQVRRRIVFNPPPIYPSEARRSNINGVGSYRLVFDPTGRIKEVQMLRSTGAAILDRSAIAALQQWKSEPGQGEWSIVIPVSFQMRTN